MVGEDVIRQIVKMAQARNRADDITGLLLSDGARYLQAIEGPEIPLRACYARIRRDPRHHDIVTVSDTAVSQRQFGRWSMLRRHQPSLADPDDVGGDVGCDFRTDFRRDVMTDVAEVTDAALKAMFIGFAALSR